MVTPEEFPTGAVRTVYEDWSQWGDYQQAGQTTASYTEELKDVEVVCNEYYGYSGNSQDIYAQAFIDSLYLEYVEENQAHPTIELVKDDNVTPYFEEGQEYEVTFPLASIVLPKCKAVDLYDPTVVCEKKINKLEEDHDGISDDIIIPVELSVQEITETGKYRVRYIAVNSNGNTSNIIDLILYVEGKDGYNTVEKAAIDSHFDYDWDSLNNEHVTYEFKERVIEISNELNAEPDHLMGIMYFESNGINLQAVNGSSNATGLIQFMPNTAIALGTSVEDLMQMSAVDQLDYVLGYYSWFPGKCTNIGDMYLATLLPIGLGKSDDFLLGEKDSNVIFYDDKTYGYVYTGNAYLDFNDDNKIEKWEPESRLVDDLNGAIPI